MEMEIQIMIEGFISMAEKLIEAISSLIKRWGQPKLPQKVRVELSDTDQEKIEVTRQLITECFGENVVERIKNASNMERITLISEFANRLVKEYGLDIEVDVMVDDINNWGAYNWDQRKAVFNITLLMVGSSHEHADHYIRETLDTIIHELRHSVQHRAINEPGFWNINDERWKAWANNMANGNYIPANVDLNGYSNQPVEKDAFTFAAAVMEGVH